MDGRRYNDDDRSERDRDVRHARDDDRPRSRDRADDRGRDRDDPPPRRERTRSPEPRREEADVNNPGNNLYVAGLSSRTTEQDLEDHFAKEGKVADCRLVVDPRSKESRGFAFVMMDSEDDAARAIKYLDRSVLQGRVISVQLAKRKRPRTPTPGRFLGVRPIRDAGYRPEPGGYGDRRGGYDSRDSGRDTGRDSYPAPRRSSPDYGPYRRNRSPDYAPYRGGGGDRGGGDRGGDRGGDYYR